MTPGGVTFPSTPAVSQQVDHWTQMYDLNSTQPPSWRKSGQQRSSGVPLPCSVLPVTADNLRDVPPGKRLVHIDFVSCTS
eukprot:g20629.t1